jgi:Mn2+/Fe2+ NRAMP family transporter
MGMMMLIVTNRDAMGRFAAGRWVKGAGWTATGLMMLTVLALVVSLLW